MLWLKDRHYAKAPIKEAIIDIQITKPATVNLESFENAETRLPPGYKERTGLLVAELQGHFADGQFTAATNQNEIGYRFVGGQGKHVVQFRVNGFTFSRLAPYETWVQFRDEAKRLWDVYHAIVGSQSVPRIGLRFINQLDLAADLRDFRDFIRCYPEVSSDLPQQLAGFFMQLQLPQVDLGAMVVITEAMVAPPRPDVVSVVLDIDVFKEGLNLESDEEIWSTVETFRLRKNLVFEGCITNTTRELIS
jgi:uncharacterized protein (TIGR04255 family)